MRSWNTASLLYVKLFYKLILEMTGWANLCFDEQKSYIDIVSDEC